MNTRPLTAFLGQVILGDCVDVLRTMPSESVDLVVTDPPYLVNYKPRDGRRCSGDDNDAWLQPAFREIYREMKPNSFCATFYGWPWIDRFLQAWRQAGLSWHPCRFQGSPARNHQWLRSILLVIDCLR